jgi:signal transduction histidine kinase
MVVAAVLGACLLVLLVPVLVLARLDGEQRALISAVQRAQALVPDAATLPPGALPTVPMADGLSVTIYLPDGQVLGVPAPLAPDVLDAARHGRASIGSSGQVDVVLPAAGLGASVPPVVRVAVPDDVWERTALRTWLLVIALALALLLAGVLVAEFLARRQVGWLDALGDGAERIAAGELSARVQPGGPPEIARLGAALDRLVARVEQLMDAQRVRSADLTHRLRTPLTALRLGVDGLRDRTAAARLSADLDALSQAVDEVIRAVRRSEEPDTPARADLVAVARERVNFWSALAEDTSRVISLAAPEQPVWVRVRHPDLRAALDALLGNVFAHTPNGIPMWLLVRASPDGGGVLIVDDAGAGFPPAEALWPGRSGGGSTGLGLDIVRRIAEDSGGGMVLDRSPSGGGRVTLSLGAPLAED